jgi:hypothetical protein
VAELVEGNDQLQVAKLEVGPEDAIDLGHAPS